MRKIDNLPSVSTFISDNSKIPIEKQIQIDVDRYVDGQIFELKISNALSCDMSEYRTAIKFLDRLPYQTTVTSEVKKYIDGLVIHLHRIEMKREKLSGNPLMPQP